MNPTSAARQQLQPVEDPVEPSTNRCISAYSPALNPDGAFAVGRVGRATIRALHLDAAGLGCENPVAGKGGKGGVDHQFSSSGLLQDDQRPGVVDQATEAAWQRRRPEL